MLMLFRSISSTTLVPRLSSSAFGRPQPPNQGISLFVACFFTSSSSSCGTCWCSSGYSSSRCLQQDKKCQNARVSVWWDFEDCKIPTGVNSFKVAPAITTAIRSSGFLGPIDVTAFGDIIPLSEIKREALYSAGVSLKQIFRGLELTADQVLLTNLMRWVSLNPPPAHVFLISSDRAFARTLHKLRMNNYNILLASKGDAPGVLSSAATIVWDWCALVKGENVIGRHFNLPPDGPCNSWYGNCKVPIQDPFAVHEQSNSVKTEESPASNSNLDPKVWFTPSSSSSDSTASGTSALYCSSRCLQQDENSWNVKISVWWDFESCHLPASANGYKVAQAITAAIRSNGIKGPITITAFGDLSHLSKTNQDALSSMGIDLVHVSQVGEAATYKALTTDLLRWVSLNPPPAHLFLISNNSCFGGILLGLRAYMYNTLTACEAHADDILRREATIVWDWSALVKGENGLGTFCDQPPNPLLESWYGYYNLPFQDPCAAIEHSESVTTEESPASTPSYQRVGEREADISKNPSLFQEKDATVVKLGDEPRGTQELVSDSSQMDEILIEDYLWRDIESFISSQKGRTIISETKTREGLARNLQKEGPLGLKPLSELHMLELVDAIISEKKWIEDDHRQCFPFTVT